jgi:tRNA threonylcarbamoyladenosine modification (KEOPS) complex  Pcc1 subunit
MSILCQDPELSDKVGKSFSIVNTTTSSSESSATATKSCLKVEFQALEAKFLRVSISSFFDMMKVAW